MRITYIYIYVYIPMCIFTSRARHWVKLYPEVIFQHDGNIRKVTVAPWEPRDALNFLTQIPGSLSWMGTTFHHIHYIFWCVFPSQTICSIIVHTLYVCIYILSYIYVLIYSMHIHIYLFA